MPGSQAQAPPRSSTATQWTLEPGGGYDQPGIHSICVDPRDSQLLYVGVSSGGTWLSEDGGDSWACVSERLPPVYCVRFA